MHTDHIRDNVLGLLTPQNYGFSDMADVFICLSGYVSGLAYDRVFKSQGFRGCQIKAGFRAAQLALACAASLLVLRLTQSDERGTTGWPVESIFAVEGASLVVGILSLYVILLLALPTMLWLERRHWGALLAPSFVLYCCALGSPIFPARFDPWRAFTGFNPLAWQLLFVLGILAHQNAARIRGRFLEHWTVLAIAIVVIEGAFLAKASHDYGQIPFAGKESLGPLRIVHLFALLLLGRAALPRADSTFWDAWPIRSITVCGRNSLAVFCAGTVLVGLVARSFPADHHDIAWQVAANAAVWSGCVVFASFRHRARYLFLHYCISTG
jgi:hypothetical protein